MSLQAIEPVTVSFASSPQSVGQGTMASERLAVIRERRRKVGGKATCEICVATLHSSLF